MSHLWMGHPWMGHPWMGPPWMGHPATAGLFGCVGCGDTLEGYRAFECGLLFCDHGCHIREELFVVEDDAVLDGVFNSADALNFASFVVEAHPACGIEDFKVG